MADLIDRGKLIDYIMESDPDWCVKPVRPIFDFINALPSADAVEERHGYWIESDADGFVCSVCRNGYRDQPTLMGKPMFDYCPVCGARMDGEKNG